jgi:Asp-tRNA(Asn)/Glu-tRNA(Gln) amidotransferase A subunit family amidase
VTDVHYLSATEALDLFRGRELSPVEMLDAVIARIDAVDDRVNAVCERMFDEARVRAVEAERRYAVKGEAPRALEGLPVALKEEQPIEGHLLEEGSLVEQGNVADVTHPVVERVWAAGGVPHIRTTTPEFSCAGFTHSKLWGVTRNPWNLEYSPGGSSGGSGAALAAGLAPLATGSDIGGSIRIPASFTGTVGFKPPYGRVPALPPFSLDTYCHDGPMARTVADCALLQNAIVGPHPADIVSLRPAYVLPEQFDSVKGMRIALCATLGDFVIDPEVAVNTHAAADALRSRGAIVDEVELPWTRERLTATAWIHFGAVFGPAISLMAAEHQDLLMPYTREFARRAAEAADNSNFIDGLVGEGEIYEPVGMLFESYDALISPTFAGTGLIAGDDYVDTQIEIAGQKFEYFDAFLTMPFNILSRCPVLSVPSGRAQNGVPTGLQIIGRTYDDATVFQVGAAVENELGLTHDRTWRPEL